jgi:flagellin-like protein
MYIMNRHFNNRAVSQVIAALLLIAIAVAAAILLYVFSIGLLGSLGSGGGQQTKEQLILEAYNWGSSTTGGSISGSFRNVGPASINIGSADVFVNGIPCTFTTIATSTLTPQGATTFTVSVATGTFVPGAAYPMKIVTPTGGVFSYSVVDGGAS